MKKTLSIILSLLMVLGTITCMFTVPVSAEEATTTPTVETLPVTDIVLNNGQPQPSHATEQGVIKPDTTNNIGGKDWPTSTRFNIKGWNAKYETDENGDFVLDEKGNKIIISGQDNSYIDPSVLYQFTFDVTVSEDINEGVKFYPVFHSNASMDQSIQKIVGMRTDKTNPTKVETAYNYGTNKASTSTDVPTTSAADAAALEAGKTYTYTYVFSAGSSHINFIRMYAEGLTAGSVKVGNATIFPLADTDAGNFYMKDKQVIPYMVEENGNVFTRLYGYRDVASDVTTKYTIAAKVGGDYYNIMLEGGKNYELAFDVRYASSKAFAASDSNGRAPNFDFFEVGALLYNADYEDIRDASDEASYNKSADQSNAQREYSAPNNGYSYCYAGATSYTHSRRIKSNIAYMAYYDQQGTLLYKSNGGYGSAQGRELNDTTGKVNNAGWIKGSYTLNAMGAQTLQEAAVAIEDPAVVGYAKNLRYRYVNGAWVFDSTKNNIVVPAKQDVAVALGMEFLYAGGVYDFDNFAFKSDIVAVPVEYKNANGETDTLANTAHTATTYFDVLANKSFATINLFESDTLTFNGWYNGDEFVSTDAEIEIEGSAANLKAVFTSKNILSYAGGFENYANGTSLEGTSVTVGPNNKDKYPTYSSAGTFRYYTPAVPSADKWTGWDNNTKLSNITDDEARAAIVADIEAAGGLMTNSGSSAFSYFNPHSKVVGSTNVTVYSDAGNYSANASTVSVNPYSGDKMLQVQASSRTTFREIAGLTAGKAYTVSFYAYNPYGYYFLKEAAIKTAPYYSPTIANDTTKVLASYITPNTQTTETWLNDKGVGASGSPQKAKDEYVGKWYKIELTFIAESDKAYLALTNQHQGNTGGYTYIDELTMVEYSCEGNHIYDDIEDTDCNLCGEARVYKSEWDFEDGSMENITVNGKSEIKVVDAVDQADKIGDKYLQYTSAGFDGMVINFDYDNAYKYVISYDFKIFKMGDGTTANGIDHYLYKFDDGKYGATGKYGLAPEEELDEDCRTETYRKNTATSLNKAGDNIITRYYEDGTPWEKVSGFTHPRRGEGAFYGTTKVDGVWAHISNSYGGAALWNEWQHVEIEVGNNNDYKGLVEFGIRPNDSGWIVGLDNFKVEKVAMTTINEAADATNGTYAFNIRARSAEKKQGLRFKSTIDLDKLNLADGAKIVEYGTLAMKKSDADQGYFLRREVATDMTDKGKVVAGVAYSSDKGVDVRYALDEATNTLTYTGVLTGIGVKNYDVDFVVRGYAIVETADGNRITVYDDQVTLSVYDAAVQIVETNTNEADVAVAQTVIDTYNAYIAQ